MSSLNPFWEYLTPVTSRASLASVSETPTRSFTYQSAGRPVRNFNLIPSSDDDLQSQTFLPRATDPSVRTRNPILTENPSKSSSRSSSRAARSLPPKYEYSSWPSAAKYSLSSSYQDEPCPKFPLTKAVILPAFIIIVPMTFLIGALFGLILGYRVKSDKSLFTQVSNSHLLENRGVFLVNYSATRIVFVASWASTMAPLLAGFIMNLHSFQSALVMTRSSSGFDQHDLPTPYQYSLLVGLCLASIGRLWRFFSYSAGKDVVIPPVLRRAARMLSLTLFLACVVFAADSAVHYTTSTIAFDRVSVSSEKLSYGRGLSEACLTLNRSENFGLPCSRNGLVAMNDYDTFARGQNEIFFLNHGISNESEILLVDQPGDNDTIQAAVIIPQHAILSTYRDYRAETVGVVTTCEPITNQCEWTDGGSNDNYSQFNCSDHFWGILGKMVQIDTTGRTVEDPDVPPLAYKPGSAVQYAYFQDADLNVPYDSAGDLGPIMEDSDLINPVYFGFAARFAAVSQRAGVNMSSDPGVHQGLTATYDVILKCQYTTSSVDYSWVNSSAYINEITPSPNGTLAELFHGYNPAGSFSSFDNDVQDLFLQAVLSENTQQLADAFANGYSKRVLGVIGPFLSARENLQEQNRTPLLVAKVPKLPLAFLVACCLGYVVLGITSVVVACRALGKLDVRDVAFRFSLPALALYAFRDRTTDEVALKPADGGHPVFDEKKITSETMRVAVEGDPRNGFSLKSLV
ncbi:hypothetical protein B0A52_02402 [Exophiala mesophila]|uniref:Uncharacterized protein n=1 Tax=Exophiala mesophila TaxID=212818 RepID=A0A438NCK5_EXOME|nr:hypothetical protein B0A52_02402 [Exophiala mesophila]